MFTPAPWPCVTAMVERRRQRWRRGRRAEAWAVLWLRLKGYRILARNFRVPVGGDWRFDLMVIRPWRRPRHLVDAWRPSAGRPSDGRAV